METFRVNIVMRIVIRAAYAVVFSPDMKYVIVVKTSGSTIRPGSWKQKSTTGGERATRTYDREDLRRVVHPERV